MEEKEKTLIEDEISHILDEVDTMRVALFKIYRYKLVNFEDWRNVDTKIEKIYDDIFLEFNKEEGN